MNNLKKYRLKNNLTQNELAEKSGVTRRYIAFMEAGDRTPSLSVAKKIATALHTKVEKIF